jgi:hypothetical protein
MSQRRKPFGSCAAALIVSAVFAACSSPTGDDFVTVPGVIMSGGGLAARVIVAPDTVRAGEDFAATLSTFGSSSCTRPTATLAYAGSALIDLSLYDLQRVSGPCTDDLQQFPRNVSLQFTSVGLATIRVRGRALARAANGQDSLVVIEKVVVVR